MDFIKALQWRYACKKMNGNAIPQEKLDTILEAVRLSPSSFGLMPFSVIVVTDQATKDKMLPVCYNQSQVSSASAILVFALWKEITPAHIAEFIQEIVDARGVTAESLEVYAQMIAGKVNGSTPEAIFQWSAKQAYIALGFAMAAAAIEEVDATPMEGFNPAGVNEVLGLEAKGLSAACLLPLGYRDEANDFLANAPKVRRSKEKLFINM
jgi:nitroreductase